MNIPITVTVYRQPQRALFIPHDGWSRTVTKLDRFAERLAEGDSPCRAAVNSGHPYGYGSKLLKQLARRLGEQAR